MAVLLWGRFPELDDTLSRLINLNGWQKADGSFRARQLLLGWDNTPMHRWAQSQMFQKPVLLSLIKQAELNSRLPLTTMRLNNKCAEFVDSTIFVIALR